MFITYMRVVYAYNIFEVWLSVKFYAPHVLSVASSTVGIVFTMLSSVWQKFLSSPWFILTFPVSRVYRMASSQRVKIKLIEISHLYLLELYNTSLIIYTLVVYLGYV